MRVGKELGEWFETSVGTREGDPKSSTLFISYLERVMDEAKENKTGVPVQGILFNKLKFADDIYLLEECSEKLQDNLRMVDEAGKAAELKINISKTKTMVRSREDIGQHLVVDSSEVENVTEFVYLGSLLTSAGDCSKEIKRRIAKGNGSHGGVQEYKE